MDTPTECPRGHALHGGTSYCTVCWVRVVPWDPYEAAARRTGRRPTILGISLLAVTGVLIGGVAAYILVGASSAPTVMALPPVATAPAPVSAPPVSTPASSAPEAPTTVVAAPVAATVVDPATGPDSGSCVVQVRDQEVACTLANDTLDFTICVPAGTERIRVRTRGTSSEPWQDASYDVALGTADGCSSNEIAADVAIDANVGDSAKWRIVARDGQRTKLWKSPLVAVTDAP